MKALKKNNQKKKIPTNSLMESFRKYCESIRKTKPNFIRFKDGNLIKHALKYLSASQIDLLFIWFLKEKGHMRPAIGSALSKGIISDFINASRREYNFYSKLDKWARFYSSGKKIEAGSAAMNEALEKFRAELFGKTKFLSDRGRTQISEEVAKLERKKHADSIYRIAHPRFDKSNRDN